MANDRINVTPGPGFEGLVRRVAEDILAAGGGDGHTGDMGDWPQSVENRLGTIFDELREIRKEMRIDFRILFGALIAVAIGLTGVMAKGFGWI